MQKSDSIKNLAKALAAVQSNLKPAVKDANNPFFKTKYADLNSVWDSCRELLAKNGFSVIQGNSVGLENTVIVETILAHESGEWIQSELCLPLAPRFTKDGRELPMDAQSVGSAITYGRRYGLAAIVGIVADADDDGNAASNGKPQVAAPIKAVEQPTTRELHATTIQRLCKELNDAGDSIKWSGKQLGEYIEAMFGDGITQDTANEKQLATVATDLAKRLTAQKKAQGATV